MIVSPTIISVTENNYAISVLLDFGEEEENKGKESSESKIDSEIKIYPSSHYNYLNLAESLETKNINFFSKNYSSEYPKIITPPPKKLL